MTIEPASGASRPVRLQTPARNARNAMCGLELLRSLRMAEASQVWFDPQYRALLDHQGYGNEGEGRERARAALPQMGAGLIEAFLVEIARALRPAGHLLMWADKFIVGSGRIERYLEVVTTLSVVDLIAWNKARLGMGRRTRCTTEYLFVIQKVPCRGTWSDHAIPDCWTEQADRSRHPHAKPHQLTERLVRAVTRRGDLVVDPCAGSYVVLDACRASGREFLGCDLIGDNQDGESR